MHDQCSILGLIEELGRRPRDAVALTFYRSAQDRTTTTNADLLRQAQAVIRNLRIRAGAGARRVGLCLPNHPFVPPLLLGLMATGCRIVPMNPAGFPADLRYMARDSRLDFVITDANTRGAFADLDVEVLDLAEVLAEHGQEPPILYEAEAASCRLVMYTSGTTSRPKGVLLQPRPLLENSLLMARWLGLDGCTQLTTLPMYHVHALTFGVFSSLLTGGRLVVLRAFEPFLWSKIVSSERVQWTSVVPSLLPLLNATGTTHAKCPDLRGVLVSSAAINEAAARRFEERSGIPVLQAWGQTEFTCWATCCREGMAGGEYDGPLRSVGVALPGIEVAVLAESGDAVAEGEEGELYLRGPYASACYLNEEELTRDTMTNRGVRTGDLGYFKTLRNERYYFISGRRKEVINRSAEKISPASVESEIFAKYPEAAGYIAVVGFKHELLGEEIGLCIDSSLFSDVGVDERSLLDDVASLHEALRPRVVNISPDKIAKTFTGKLQRSRMGTRFDSEKSYIGDFKIVDRRLEAV